LLQKGPLQNGPTTRWAMPKRASTKQAVPKWSRKKDVLPNIHVFILVYFTI